MSSFAAESRPAQERGLPLGIGAPASCLRDVHVRMSDRWALRGVSVRVERGASMLVTGSNGAGKTTLLRVMAGLVRPSSGTVELFGAGSGARGESVKRRIGLIGHQPMLYRELTAHANLMFFARLYALDRAEARVAEVLERVELTARSGDPVRCMSRGMVQRLAVARAVLHEPELVLADEPCSGLDDHSHGLVRAILNDRLAAGAAVVVSGHGAECDAVQTVHSVLHLCAGTCRAGPATTGLPNGGAS